jgi:rod shape determining protein RodA
MFSRLRHLDWTLLVALAILAAASVISLLSFAPSFAPRQIAWFAAAFFFIIFGSQIDWRWLGNQAWFRYGVYWVTILFLVLTHIHPTIVRGTKSWLVLGPIQFQPAELAKLALIFLLASFFTRRHIEAWRGKNLLVSFGYLALPVLLVLAHPDLGSAAILIGIWIGFLLLSGVNVKRLLVGLLIAAILAGVAWQFVLKPYQQDRIRAFLFSSGDPLGINYNVLQSKIAIGSAGFWGKGYQAGTQTQLGFLPEPTSDFLFAAFIEEWGFLGGMLILLTFLVLLYRIMRTGLRARDNYSRFVVLGGGLFFLIHFCINVGSSLGLIPVAGITFPFFSYGGSNLLTSAALLAILEHIHCESSS